MGATPADPNAYGERMRVIVVESDATIRETVTSAFVSRGHTVTPMDSVSEAVRWIEAGIVDLVVADLASATGNDSRLVHSVLSRRAPVPLVVTTREGEEAPAELLKSASADALEYPFVDDALDEAIEKVHAHHVLHFDLLKIRPFMTERVEFDIPSKVEYLDGILNHLSERLVTLRVVEPESIEVVVALDEAIVNAIKHGNGYDPAKRVKIVAEISNGEAHFEVTDEGPGFREQDVPDPCLPENLLRTSGRGILLIRSIMDEVSFKGRGNCIAMTKRADTNGSKPRPSGGAESSGPQPIA